MRRGIAPATLVIAVVVVGWLVTGVSALDVIRFVAYDIGFVALPGVALLWAVRGRRSSFLVSIALGWPLGQALEILAFSGTAAIGIRWTVSCSIPCLSSSSIAHSRSGAAGVTVEAITGRRGMPATAMWIVGSCVVDGRRLPHDDVPSPRAAPGSTCSLRVPRFSVLPGLDRASHVPLATDHSGSVQRRTSTYEWFVLFHIAAASQMTHVPISTIALRLDYLPTVARRRKPASRCRARQEPICVDRRDRSRDPFPTRAT